MAKIIFKEIPTPQSSVFTSMEDFDWGSINNDSQDLRIDVTSPTKTRRGLILYKGETAIKINLENSNFKQDKVESASFLRGTRYTEYLYKKSKAQDFAKFKDYIAEQINTVLSMKEVNFEGELTVKHYSNFENKFKF